MARWKMGRILLCLLVFLLLPACVPQDGGTVEDDTPPVLSLPVDDENGARPVFINTYYGQPGCSEKTDENPYGIHYSIDFKVLVRFLSGPGGGEWIFSEAPVRASCPGTVTDIIIRQTTSEGYVYANVLVRYNRRYSVDYNFEPATRIVVKKGDNVTTGELLGYLAPCPDNLNGALDWGLGDNVERLRKCPVPFLTPEAKAKMEEWYRANDWASTGKPYPMGPCVCHYPHYQI